MPFFLIWDVLGCNFYMSETRGIQWRNNRGSVQTEWNYGSLSKDLEGKK